jgi:small nuclear ribonucleoprotein B and B'
MAFDRHMNIVLGDSEEFRNIKAKKGTGITEEKLEKRVLGLIILRGDSVVSMTIEGPPPPEGDEKITPGGPGVAKAAGRGLPIAPMGVAPVGLSGPVRGIGGPSPMMMAPQLAAQMGAQGPPGMNMMQGGMPPRPMMGAPGGIPGGVPGGIPGGMPGMPPRGIPGMPMAPPSNMPGFPPPPPGSL